MEKTDYSLDDLRAGLRRLRLIYEPDQGADVDRGVLCAEIDSLLETGNVCPGQPEPARW